MSYFESFGFLKYRSSKWVTLHCCSDLMRLYQSQIKEKKSCIQSPLHGSHITVCNGRWEFPRTKEWGKGDGKKIWFTYSNRIIEDNRFFYIKVSCPEIASIREGLGLAPLFGHPILKRGLHLTLARKNTENTDERSDK